MENFSLSDLAWILGSVIAFAVACVVMPPLFRYGPRVVKIVLWFVYDAFYYFFIFKWNRNMSSEEAEPPANEPVQDVVWSGAGNAAREHQHQVEGDSHQSSEPMRELPSLHMTREEEIAWLAGLKQDDGTYRHSANKIAALMGGTESVVKAQVAAIRTPDKPKTPNGAPLRRPANGW